jgi:hypothetical protein
MNRREFLRLTVRGRERVLELSCERLYVRWIDAQAGAAFGDDLMRADAENLEDELSFLDADWDGEPLLDVVVPTTAELFEELERRLRSVQVLRVTGREWLAGDDFRREVESRIEAFRRRGGRVE